MARIRAISSVVVLAALAIASARPAVVERPTEGPFIVVLGVAQDAGYPQAACRKACCLPAWEDESLRRAVACMGLVDPSTHERWIIDATPDFPDQLRKLDELAPVNDRGNTSQPALSGVLLTHAHIGHYTGLMHLGREVTGARGVPVYAMARMRRFLENNGPWDQLVALENIELRTLEDGVTVRLSASLEVTPLLVPHRDEYSETVGFRISGPGRSVLYIPDIDKWDRWDRPLIEEIARVDVAYLDGTFFRNGEIDGRDMANIPHPFIEETMALLDDLPDAERAKVRFIHLNHTNPAIIEGSEACDTLVERGYRVARQGEIVPLSLD